MLVMLRERRRERIGRAVSGELNLACETPVPKEAVPKAMRGLVEGHILLYLRVWELGSAFCLKEGRRTQCVKLLKNTLISPQLWLSLLHSITLPF